MMMITHSKNNGTRDAATESGADILEREHDALIHDWIQLVEQQDDLMAITLGYEDRTGHLPALLPSFPSITLSDRGFVDCTAVCGRCP